MNRHFGALPAVAGLPSSKDPKTVKAEYLVAQLFRTELRGSTLHELSQLHKRETIQDMAPLLWSTDGIIGILLQEIVSIYSKLSPPTLSYAESSRVCNALVLLQCVAFHPDTRQLFVDARISIYLHPFLAVERKTIPGGQTRAFEHLRITSLAVIGTLVKFDDSNVIHYLIETQIMPLCLRAIVEGGELSKEVSTFIVEKILLDDLGLAYICVLADRFFALANALARMVSVLAESPSPRLLETIIRCYLRLTDHPRARFAVHGCLPHMLKDGTFHACMEADPVMRMELQRLLSLPGMNSIFQHHSGTGFPQLS